MHKIFYIIILQNYLRFSRISKTYIVRTASLELLNNVLGTFAEYSSYGFSKELFDDIFNEIFTIFFYFQIV